MTIVRNVEGVWTAFQGPPVALTRMETTVQIHFADGRVISDVPVDPYPVELSIDPTKVAQLVAEGLWGADQLEPLGLKIAVPFVVPDGKQPLGEQRFELVDGQVREVWDVEDIPAPPPPPTRDEKVAALLAAFDLTLDDLKGLVQDPAEGS